MEGLLFIAPQTDQLHGWMLMTHELQTHAYLPDLLIPRLDFRRSRKCLSLTSVDPSIYFKAMEQNRKRQDMSL